MATRAAEVMTREVICIPAETTTTEALVLMRKECVRHLPVVEHGRLVGILSDRDLLGASSAQRTVADAMTRAPITCSATTQIGRLAELMVNNRIDCLPIMRGEALIGIVTSTDLLQLLVKRSEQLLDVLPFDFTLREFRGSSMAVPA